MPESQKKEIQSLDSQIAVVDHALEQVKKNPTAFTFARGAATMAGAIPESIAGRQDTDAERQARSFVFNTVSKTINERAGAAQSAQELARLRSFLPGELDDAEQIDSKFKSFKAYLNEQRDVYAAPIGSPPNRGASGNVVDFNSLPKRGGP
jgi:hypothetical protein